MSQEKEILSGVLRKAEREDEAKLLSWEFGAEVAGILPHNQLARAMTDGLPHEGSEVFQCYLEAETTRLRDLERELEQTTKKMRQAQNKLRDVMENDTKKQSIKLPSFFPSDDEQNDKKEQKISGVCKDIIQTSKEFSILLNLIPVNNEYIEVLAGVFRTISEATANHRRIGKGFQSAVNRIGLEMKYCGQHLSIAKQSHRSDQQRVMIQVAHFSCKVFSFLIPYTVWCTSRFKRVKISLDPSYYEKNVQGPLDDILAVTRELERGGNLQVKESILRLEKGQRRLEEKIDARLARRENCAACLPIEDPERLYHMLGKQGNNLTFVMALIQSSQEKAFEKDKLRHQRLLHPWLSEIKQHTLSDLKRGVTLASDQEPFIRFEAIEVNSRHLEMTSKNGYPIDALTGLEDMPILPRIFQRLQRWISTSDSQRLWIHGSANSMIPSEVSLAAASVVLIGEDNKINLIAYRIDREIQESLSSNAEDSDAESIASISSSETGSSSEIYYLLLMIYSLIRQMVWLLPNQIETETDFSFDRFNRLDGTLKSLPDAYQIFKDLLELMPAQLLCVIDGIQMVDGGWYDDEGLQPSDCFEKFLHILWKAEKERVLKVLLVSDGWCPTLQLEENIRFGEEFEVEDEEGIGQMHLREDWDVSD